MLICKDCKFVRNTCNQYLFKILHNTVFIKDSLIFYKNGKDKIIKVLTREIVEVVMKKLCLVLVFMLFIGNLPSFAMKIIVNNDNDRIVYSRSSFPGDEADSSYNNNDDGNVPVNYKKNNLTNEQLQYLTNEIRDELIGTYWNFDENNAQNVNNTDNSADFNSTAYNKRGSREAADYYMFDSIKAPYTPVPSGFPQ